MKKILIGIFSFLLIGISYAQNPPLRVAVGFFAPPFVMQGGNNQLFGFDVMMMETLCQSMQRDCQFKLVRFDKLFSRLRQNQSDVAIGAIAITSERAQMVNFSSPYFPSQSRFLGLKKNFVLSKSLANKTIGIEEGTIFANEIQQMGLGKNTIIRYPTESAVIEALFEEDIELALLDTESTNYWVIQSSGIFTAVGPSMPFGYGLAIAVKPGDNALLDSINQALDQYIKSKDYKKNYEIYFGRSL